MSHIALRLRHFTSVVEGVAPDSTGNPASLKVVVGALGHRIRITNLDAVNNLEISFSSGEQWYPVGVAAELAEDGLFHFFFLRGIGGAVAWTALVAAG